MGLPEVASRPRGNQEAPRSLSGLTQTPDRRETSPNLLARSDMQWDSEPTAIRGTTGAKFLAKQDGVSTRWESSGGWEHHFAVEPKAGPQQTPERQQHSTRRGWAWAQAPGTQSSLGECCVPLNSRDLGCDSYVPNHARMKMGFLQVFYL